MLLQLIMNMLETTRKMESLKKESEELSVKFRNETYNNQN